MTAALLTPQDTAQHTAARPAMAEPRAAAGPAPSDLAGALPALPMRDGSILLPALIDLYMAHYAGRDPMRPQRLRWWAAQLPDVALQDLSDDNLHAAVERLSQQRSRYFAGKDADGNAIFRAKRDTLSPATLNRYVAALGAVVSWSIKKRIVLAPTEI